MDPSNFSGKPLWMLAGSATLTAGVNAHHQLKQSRAKQAREAYKIVKEYSENTVTKEAAIETITYLNNRKFAFGGSGKRVGQRFYA